MICRWGVGTFDATPAANDDELDLVPGAASVDHDAFALGSNPRGGGDGGFFGATGPVAPGSPTRRRTTRDAGSSAASAPGISFEPEDDPVVCRMVDAAQEQARARVAAARERARAAAGAEARRRESTPAAPRSAAPPTSSGAWTRRKYAELASVVERLAVRAETHGSARDALSGRGRRGGGGARRAEAEKRHDLVERLGRPSPRGLARRLGGGALAVGGAV